jgi:hypothetical protein
VAPTKYIEDINNDGQGGGIAKVAWNFRHAFSRTATTKAKIRIDQIFGLHIPMCGLNLYTIMAVAVVNTAAAKGFKINTDALRGSRYSTN